jgi:hypothetical protein
MRGALTHAHLARSAPYARPPDAAASGGEGSAPPELDSAPLPRGGLPAAVLFTAATGGGLRPSALSPDEDPDRRAGCESKSRYSRARAAAKAKRMRQRHDGARLTEYRCPFCGWWHIGERLA